MPFGNHSLRLLQPQDVTGCAFAVKLLPLTCDSLPQSHRHLHTVFLPSFPEGKMAVNRPNLRPESILVRSCMAGIVATRAALARGFSYLADFLQK